MQIISSFNLIIGNSNVGRRCYFLEDKPPSLITLIRSDQTGNLQTQFPINKNARDKF